MGALTSNRKRGDDYLGFNRTTNSSAYDNHISKKPRFSHIFQSPDDRSVSSKSSVSRIYRYPETSTPLRREVHAPTPIFKFNLSARLVRESSIFRKREARVEEDERGDIMGNCLSHRYEHAKSSAFDSLRYVKKDKEVIDVDEEEVRVEQVSDDSSVEEIEFVEDGREGRSVVLDQRSRDNSEAAIKVEELDTKPSYSSAVTDLTNDSWKMENAEKMLDSLSLNEGMNVEPVHKRLLNSAERRNPKLNSLNFQIDYHMQRWSWLRLLRPVKKPEEVVPKEAFAPLTNEEEEEVARAFSANRRRVLVTHETSNIEITGEILQCLRPGAWLNDEVINLYLELLKERERRDPKKFLKCHFFNTFFYKKLIGGRDGYDFKSVKRWTTQRKLGYGLIECDKIFVPIHKEIHWCLAVINKKDEKFQYLDSLGGTDSKVLKKLARYFVDEVNDKSGIDIDVSSWEQEFVEDLPDQRNGWDCGMFMVKYADFYSRGVGLCFNQEHMPYFRLRTAKEILRLKAD